MSLLVWLWRRVSFRRKGDDTRMTRTFKLWASKPHEAPVHEEAQIFVDIGTLVSIWTFLDIDIRVEDGIRTLWTSKAAAVVVATDVGVRDYDGVKDERVDDGYAYIYSPLYLQWYPERSSIVYIRGVQGHRHSGLNITRSWQSSPLVHRDLAEGWNNFELDGWKDKALEKVLYLANSSC